MFFFHNINNTLALKTGCFLDFTRLFFKISQRKNTGQTVILEGGKFQRIYYRD